jgi:hypothetical protein
MLPEKQVSMDKGLIWSLEYSHEDKLILTNINVRSNKLKVSTVYALILCPS